MDLSNVVFIENKPPTTQIPKTKGKQKTPPKKSNGKKIKPTSKNKQPVKKAVVLKKKKGASNKAGIKRNKKQGRVAVVKSPKPNSKFQTEEEEGSCPARSLGCGDRLLLEQQEKAKSWNKIPPAAGEPIFKKHNGKVYYWCYHCNFWSLHKPGRGKRCQAVDPLAHLLSYFGGKNLGATTNLTQTQSSPPPQQQQHYNNSDVVLDMDWDDISL